MSRLPTGTVTFLFTDVEGSTRMLHELGAERYVEVSQEHRRLLRQAFDRHGGVEVDTQGDAFFVDDGPRQAAALSNLANVAVVDGDFAGARSLLERCVALAREAGDDLRVAVSIHNLAAESVERALGAETTTALWAEGRAYPLARMVDLALRIDAVALD